MSDLIIERLQAMNLQTCDEAADRITELKAENSRLRADVVEARQWAEKLQGMVREFATTTGQYRQLIEAGRLLDDVAAKSKEAGDE